MATIKQADFIESITEALQFISFYHPVDFIDAMRVAYEKEASPAAKDAIAQILINSRMSALGHRPMCQDTGIVCVFIKMGMAVQWDKTDLTLQEMVDEGTRKAYMNAENPLRASIVSDPAGKRLNTKDNTPAVVHVEMVPGDEIEVSLAAKGGGSEFKSKFKVLNPSDSIVDWVLEMLPLMGAGWCPPGILGIGIGGTAEKAMILAKEVLNDPIDMPELLARGPKNRVEELRVEIYHAVNKLGIGAQGLGGLTTVLDVKINDFPTHIACLPVAMIPNCASTRHVHFHLNGSGPAQFEAPSLDHWPELEFNPSDAQHMDLNTVTAADLQNLEAGQTVLLSGKMLTGRDAAHKRIADMLDKGEPLPVDFHNRFIYYVGPVKAVRDEVVGPAGPTTATRMDKFTKMMLSDKVGVLGMIGKAERGEETVQLLKEHQRVYLMAVGGSAYLIAKAISEAKVLAFEDLGTEAIHEFEVKNMPVTVAVDTHGVSVHKTGPEKWRKKIEAIPVAVVKK